MVDIQVITATFQIKLKCGENQTVVLWSHYIPHAVLKEETYNTILQVL